MNLTYFNWEYYDLRQYSSEPWTNGNKKTFLCQSDRQLRQSRDYCNWWKLCSLIPNLLSFQETIREHIKTLDENAPRDFIDMYLKEIKKNDGINNVTFTGKKCSILFRK
jgi:hypothetical protein